MSNDHNRRGFTLVELLVVMVMIFAFAAVVAPRFSQFVPSLRVESSARDLMAAGRKCHADAALQWRIVRLVVDQENQTFQIKMQGDPFKDPEEYSPPASAWADPLTLPQGVRFESVDGAEDTGDGTQYFEFRPDGSASDGTIVLTNDKGTEHTVKIVGISGRVYIENDENRQE